MVDLLKNIVKNAKVTKEMASIHTVHPITGERFPKRTFFVLLKKYAKDFFEKGIEPRMVGLAGLRGTGKTTLIWQLADELLSKYPYPVYFFNVNEIAISGYTLWETLEAFQYYILNKKFSEVKTPFVLLFDEIHDSPDWAKTLKVLYDEARSAFVVCTGSSALLLRQTADLARRIKIEKVYPFRFIEFVMAKSFFETKNKNTIYPKNKLTENIKNILFYSQDFTSLFQALKEVEVFIKDYFKNIEKVLRQNINILCEDYINYYNIPAFILYQEKSVILKSVFDLLTRVVYEDVKKIDEKMNISPNSILKMLLQLSISDEINLAVLSQKVESKKEDIEFILEIMQKAELVNILYPYTGAEGRIWKNKKAFFMSPSLRLSLLYLLYGENIPNNLKGKLYEDIVVMYLRKTLNEVQISFTKSDKGSSPDFIVETRERPIVIEVGKSKTKTQQLKSINKRYGILISSGISEIEIEDNIIKLPLTVFLLI